MNLLKRFGVMLAFASLLFSCVDEPFYDSGDNYPQPYDLLYSQVTNVREYSAVKSGKPTIMTGGLVPVYELMSVRDADGNLLDGEYVETVDIIQASLLEVGMSESYHYVDENGDTITSYEGIDSKDAGIITIQDGNPYGLGDYYFTIKAMIVTPDSTLLTTVFEDAFHLTVGPQLVKNLFYWPIIQNLVSSVNNPSSQPFLLSGNEDVSFSLGSDDDKLSIAKETGVISINPSYSIEAGDTILPSVIVTSNITEEVTTFQGKDFLQIILSTDSIDVPVLDAINFFYPTFEARNAMYGYKYHIIEEGSVTESNVWKTDNPTNFPGAADERPEATASEISSIWTNVTEGDWLPHESWVTLNSQDLSLYSKDFDMIATFYNQNKYVEYLEDGTTPTSLSVKVATNFTGDVLDAEWIKVDDMLTSIVAGTSEEFSGLPYPGDQSGDDPFNEKGHNADAKWVKCVMDLTPFKEATNFTLAFHLESHFTGGLDNGKTVKGRPGRYYISDVHYTAKIK